MLLLVHLLPLFGNCRFHLLSRLGRPGRRKPIHARQGQRNDCPTGELQRSADVSRALYNLWTRWRPKPRILHLSFDIWLRGHARSPIEYRQTPPFHLSSISTAIMSALGDVECLMGRWSFWRDLHHQDDQCDSLASLLSLSRRLAYG